MKRILFLITLVLSCSMGRLSAQMERFEEMLPMMNADSLRQTVLDLQSFGTRFWLHEHENGRVGNLRVAEYVASRLNAYGVQTSIDSSLQEGNHWFGGPYSSMIYNVQGVMEPDGPSDSIVIIGAHLDAIATQPSGSSLMVLPNCPGADDNASGIAVMIEMARIIQLSGLRPHHTIHFMAYDAEEYGLIGSVHDAWQRSERGDKVVLMINNDMVSYQPDDDWQLCLHWYSNALDILPVAAELCEQYTDITPFVPSDAENGNARASDSYAYSTYGFKAIFAIEKTFSLSYHTDHDVADSNNYDYLSHVARYNWAMLYHYAFATPTTSIGGQTATPQFLVYPNPATSSLQISVADGTHPYTVQLFDLCGKQLSTQTMDHENGNMDISELPSGIYLLKILSGNRTVGVQKVVKK
ncbi:MAG: M28 family peptidase [Bacteroidales bacterium]|nr:M28 family peptidase [Bacteroidales bacterium]